MSLSSSKNTDSEQRLYWPLVISLFRCNVQQFSMPFEQALARCVAEREVTDTDGREWRLRNDAVTGQPPKLVIFYERSGSSSCPILLCSPRRLTVRLRSLDEAASDVNLPADAQDTWRGIP